MVTKTTSSGAVGSVADELNQKAENVAVDAPAVSVESEVENETVSEAAATAAEPEQPAVAEPENEINPETADAETEEFAARSRRELLDSLEQILDEQTEMTQELRHTVDKIKRAFYKTLHRPDSRAAQMSSADGGESLHDDDEQRFKELYERYRRLRNEHTAESDREKEENYKMRLAIIEELKELVNADEIVGQTFTKFYELKQRWTEAGAVPQQYVNDVWETYHFHVDNFYNFVKINKELRDLEWKRNLECKENLCASAEALADDKSVVQAFHKLQKLHDEWRETGPVAPEYKDALWERFKAASTVINKRHQEHFENLKEEEKHNLELKSALCDEVESILAAQPSTLKAWNKASERLQNIQTRWREIGFAPRKENDRIYERFRAACDRFFERKREFYSGVRDDMARNLELKTKICETAEALRDSEEWKAATDKLIALQAEWKTIGAVSRRHSDAVWKRFRAACDEFFERKSKHFASVDDEYGDNLARKTALIAEMMAADIENGGHEMIKDFQRRWSEIGYVPIKAKNAIQKQYKEAVDKMFGALRGSEQERSFTRFREKVSSMAAAGDRRLSAERERLYNKVRRLEQDIALLENNIGFFSKSVGAEKLIADVKEKIERAKHELTETIEKVKLIDKSSEQ